MATPSRPSSPDRDPSTKEDPEEDINGEEEEDDEDDEDEEEEEFEEDDDEEEETTPSGAAVERAKLKSVLSRLSTGPMWLRVHDVVIKGNSKTKDSLIEAEVLDVLRSASTMQELLNAAAISSTRLRQLDIFDSVSITLDAGPPELPGTANVVIEVAEAKNPLSVDVGAFSKPGARTWSLEGSLKLKNFFGYGDIWDASGVYGWEQTSEISAGVSLPRFKAIPTPLICRISMLSEDWLKFSSYKERLLGLSVGMVSTRNHNLVYSLTWRSLTDPTRMASKSVRRLLGHNLLSSIKYTYKIDNRDSHLRPTSGYAFLSSSQVGGLSPDSKSLRFIRQEFDLRGAFPLGFYNTALNCGISTGVLMPWGRGFMSSPSPLPERFYMGGHSSLVCSLGGPTSLLGFKSRGLGPTDARRFIPNKPDRDESDTSGRDVLGGDLAVTAFLDLSFDLPVKLLRESGIHGHVFASTGNLAKLTENEYKNFSVQKFLHTFRTSAGFGVIVPTRLFRMEINYCYILRQFEHDRGKTGIQFSFSTPS